MAQGEKGPAGLKEEKPPDEGTGCSGDMSGQGMALEEWLDAAEGIP